MFFFLSEMNRNIISFPSEFSYDDNKSNAAVVNIFPGGAAALHDLKAVFLQGKSCSQLMTNSHLLVLGIL